MSIAGWEDAEAIVYALEIAVEATHETDEMWMRVKAELARRGRKTSDTRLSDARAGEIVGG